MKEPRGVLQDQGRWEAHPRLTCWKGEEQAGGGCPQAWLPCRSLPLLSPSLTWARPRQHGGPAGQQLHQEQEAAIEQHHQERGAGEVLHLNPPGSNFSYNAIVSHCGATTLLVPPAGATPNLCSTNNSGVSGWPDLSSRPRNKHMKHITCLTPLFTRYYALFPHWLCYAAWKWFLFL